jgi:hypothetical protein
MASFYTVFVGVILAAIGAVFLALSMSVQRYALTTEPPVPFLRCKLPRFWVWLSGLLIYFASNGLFAASLIFAPLSLLAGIFTTLLLWNLFFGKRLLNELLTPQKWQGAIVIMIGVVLTVSGTSSKVPTEFSTDQIEKLFTKVGGCVYVVFLVVMIIVCVAIIFLFEKKYPIEDDEVTPVCSTHESTPTNSNKSQMSDSCVRDTETSSRKSGALRKNLSSHLLVPGLNSGHAARGPSIAKRHRQITLLRSLTTSFGTGDTEPLVNFICKYSSFYARPKEMKKKVPYWLDKCMLVIYPGSLGLDEGIAHLSMKAFMSLFAQCGSAGTCGKPIIWLMVLSWLISSLATLWWLRTVFKRYDTTKALPIEYGTVMATNALSGLIFYNESRYMSTAQIGLIGLGVVVILLGLAVGLRDKKESKSAQKKETETGHITFADGGQTKDTTPLNNTPLTSSAGGLQAIIEVVDDDDKVTDDDDEDDSEGGRSRRRTQQSLIYLTTSAMNLPMSKEGEVSEDDSSSSVYKL